MKRIFITLANHNYPWDQSASDILDIRAWWGGDNAGPGYTWQSNSVNDCLDDSEMNMFHNRVWSTIYGAQSELAQNGYPPQGANPANRDVLNVNIDASWPLIGGNPFGFHYAQQITFGIPVL